MPTLGNLYASPLGVRAHVNNISTKIRECLKRVGAVLLMGEVTEARLGEVFTAAGVEHALSVPLSTIAWSYASTRAYWLSAKLLKLQRADIRRVLLVAHETLTASTDMRQQACGAWLWGIFEKSDPNGSGLAKREIRGHDLSITHNSVFFFMPLRDDQQSGPFSE